MRVEEIWLSRRQMLHRSAVAFGGLAGVGMGLVDPLAAIARTRGHPRPIPGGFSKSFKPVAKNPYVHVLPPGIGFEMSTITDFNGVVGAAEIRGTAQGSDGSSYDFDADMRFMRGTYVGFDGRRHNAAFGFV